MNIYRLVKFGKKEVREYPILNYSPLFKGLFPHKMINWQDISYEKFLNNDLHDLFSNYFPAEFEDYNNKVFVSAENIEVSEPVMSKEDAISLSLTWAYTVSFVWKVSWECKRMQIKILSDSEVNDLKNKKKKEEENIIWSCINEDEVLIAETINFWVKESFRIGKFSLTKDSSNLWKIKEKDSNLVISINISDKNNGVLIINFNCYQEKRIPLCSLPKISKEGNFIINGHRKAIVFQSVRAPSIYHFFSKEDNKHFMELIPYKGPWIKIYYTKNYLDIEVKFLNSGLIFSLLDILKSFSFPEEKLSSFFTSDTLNIDNYNEAKKIEPGINFPRLFISIEKNSYFRMGRLGRKKFNSKIIGKGFFKKIKGKVLADDLLDIDGNTIFKKDDVIDENEISKLKILFKKKKLNFIEVPNSFNKLFAIKLKTSFFDDNNSLVNKDLFAVCNDETFELDENDKEKLKEKDFFDISDLICIISSYIMVSCGCGSVEKVGAKDGLDNQFIRRVGDLFYNIFDIKLGSFLQSIDNKYLAYISQLRKVDLLKIPSLGEFEKSFKNFSNISVLVQLLNENNPLSEDSHMKKVSVLGYGGFKSNIGEGGPAFDARNFHHTFAGRYDSIETPEGQKVGLNHYLTSSAKINSYGQLEAPYYIVKNGIITNSLVYLDSDEEYDKYITHPSIKIDENNIILESEIPAFYQGKVIIVPKEKIEYIYSSFFQLNSFSTPAPFFGNSDPTRTLMAANLNKQAVPIFNAEKPLILSGTESALFDNSSLTVKSEFNGVITYVDIKKIILKADNEVNEIIYNIPQLSVSNKNILNFSSPLVKKGDIVKIGQPIACGDYFKDEVLSLGRNLRVAYMCFDGSNYEDGIVLNERVRFPYFFVKKHVIIRKNTKYGEEFLTKTISNLSIHESSYLDDNGIIKIGSKVKGGEILVGKLTPQPSQREESEEELLLLNILGTKSRRFVNSSLYLPEWESGEVYKINRRLIQKKGRGKKGIGDIEIIEIYVAEKRKVEVGDKITTRFGNKGVVAKIFKDSNMPFNKYGETFDIILNPLGVPSRMNVGQLLETILAKSAKKLDVNFLFKPFNSPDIDIIENILNESKIENFGSEELFDGFTGMPYKKKVYTGYIYTFLLNHKVADKFHSRSNGPVSLITQQPLKGRANNGAMRAGEMEISVLASHGARLNISSFLGPKSDDIKKRRLYRDSIIYGGTEGIDYNNNKTESFNRILQILRGMGFDLKAFDKDNNVIDFYKYYSGYDNYKKNSGKEKEKIENT